MDWHILLACFLELLSCIVLILNGIAFLLSFGSDLKNYMLMALLILQLATAAIFVVIIGPTAIACCNLFPDDYYVIADVLGNALWFMCALLKATIALERLFVFMYANASQFVNKISTILIILGLETLLSTLGWLFVYTKEKSVFTDSFADSTFALRGFPEPLNFAKLSTIAVTGVIIDITVTVISITSYAAIYARMNQLKKNTFCLLSERQAYRRRQKEFKLVVEFCISTALYLGLWLIVRVITPYVERNGNKIRTLHELLPFLQVLYIGSHATLYMVFFGRKKGKTTNPNPGAKSTTTVAPKKFNNKIWGSFCRNEQK